MTDEVRAAGLPDAEMWRAGDLRRQGKWLYAVQFYRRVIQRFPQHGEAYAELSRVYAERDQWRSAREVLLQGLVQLPHDHALSFQLGNVYLNDGNLEKAPAAFRCTLESQPDNLAATFNLGLALVRLGRNAEAINVLTGLWERQADYRGLAELLGGTYLSVGFPEKAIAVLEPVEASSGQSARYFYLLALAYSGVLRWGDALRRLREAHRLAPGDPEIMRCFGWALVKLKLPGEAVTWLRRAVETDPNLVYAHINLAIAFYEQGKTKDGFAELKRAHILDPENPWVTQCLEQWNRALFSGDERPTEGTDEPRSKGRSNADG
jgi:tetratricopeptide (TPR) repeat protein